MAKWLCASKRDIDHVPRHASIISLELLSTWYTSCNRGYFAKSGSMQEAPKLGKVIFSLLHISDTYAIIIYYKRRLWPRVDSLQSYCWYSSVPIIFL